MNEWIFSGRPPGSVPHSGVGTNNVPEPGAREAKAPFHRSAGDLGRSRKGPLVTSGTEAVHNGLDRLASLLAAIDLKPLGALTTALQWGLVARLLVSDAVVLALVLAVCTPVVKLSGRARRDAVMLSHGMSLIATWLLVPLMPGVFTMFTLVLLASLRTVLVTRLWRARPGRCRPGGARRRFAQEIW